MKNGDNAIRMNDRRSNLPGPARGPQSRLLQTPFWTPRERLWFTHAGRRLSREPFSRNFRAQFQYAALGLLLAIPADGGAGYGRHSDARTG